jgi:hypothetical protein
MTHAIIRGKNGRRHEVDFGESPVRLEVYASETTIEIFVEADFETLPEERRRFALILGAAAGKRNQKSKHSPMRMPHVATITEFGNVFPGAFTCVPRTARLNSDHSKSC